MNSSPHRDEGELPFSPRRIREVGILALSLEKAFPGIDDGRVRVS
jgi:hypothetical protein